MAFVANKGQNKGKRFVYSIPLLSTMLSEAKPSYVYAIRCDSREIIKGILQLPDWSQAVVRQHLGIPAKRVFLVVNCQTNNVEISSPVNSL